MASQTRRKAAANEPAVLSAVRAASQQCKYHFERAKAEGWRTGVSKIGKAEKALEELLVRPPIDSYK